MRITFNKGNWTGEETTINVRKQDHSWLLNGTRYWLVFSYRDNRQPYFAELHGDAWNPTGPLAKGYRLTLTPGYNRIWQFEAVGCQREHESPYVAASQIIFNTV